jgi:hypothetical protein
MTGRLIRFPPRAVFVTAGEGAWLVLGPRGHGWLHGDHRSAMQDARWHGANCRLPVRDINTFGPTSPVSRAAQSHQITESIDIMKTSIVCASWRPLHKNTLRGFAEIQIRELRLKVKDIAVHQKADRCWAQLPARPRIDGGKAVTDAEGGVQYFPIMAFDDRATADAFSGAVIDAVLRHDPHALDEDRPARTPAMAGATDDDTPF